MSKYRLLHLVRKKREHGQSTMAELAALSMVTGKKDADKAVKKALMHVGTVANGDSYVKAMDKVEQGIKLLTNQVTARMVIYCHSCQYGVDCAGLDKDDVEFLAELHRCQEGHAMVQIPQDEYNEWMRGRKLETGQGWRTSDSPRSEPSMISLSCTECLSFPYFAFDPLRESPEAENLFPPIF